MPKSVAHTRLVRLAAFPDYQIDHIKLVEFMSQLKEVYTQGQKANCTDMWIEAGVEEGYDGHTFKMQVHGRRPETPKEKEAREKAAAKVKETLKQSKARSKELKEAHDRKEWERLKAKYGKGA